MTGKKALVALFALLMPGLAMAQGAVQWGSSEKAYRQPVEGMKGYYEPRKVSYDYEAGVVSFTVFRFADPAVPDEVGAYLVNCETHEYATVEKGRAPRPEKLLPGESLHLIASRLCNWGGKGLFN